MVGVEDGLVHAYVLDGHGGARSAVLEQLNQLTLLDSETLWLHWDRGHPQTQRWLRAESGVGEFSCDALLEENTRPRVLTLPEGQTLVFLRGVNLNPGAEPEDMVSVRIYAQGRRVISLRLRPLRATEELIASLMAGSGPISGPDLVLQLTDHLTAKMETTLDGLSEQIDQEEEQIDADERYLPAHDHMLHLRRRAAGLRRFLAPQRDLCAQLARNDFGDGDQWNELNNRLTRYLEELEMVRERVSLVLESEQRRMGERMNRAMYMLGIVTGIFLPMSFLTGLLGINVGGIPGADNEGAFALTCVMMLALAALQIWIFRKLRWL